MAELYLVTFIDASRDFTLFPEHLQMAHHTPWIRKRGRPEPCSPCRHYPPNANRLRKCRRNTCGRNHTRKPTNSPPLHFFAACVDYGRIQAADVSVCLYHQFPLVTAGRCKGRKRRHLSRFRCAQSRRSRDITKRTYPVSFYGWLLSIRSEVKLCELDRIAAYYLADFEAEVLPLLACDIEVVLYTLEVVGRQTAVACHGGDG